MNISVQDWLIQDTPDNLQSSFMQQTGSQTNLTPLRGLRTVGSHNTSPHSSKKFFDSGDYALYKAGMLSTPIGNMHPSPDTLRSSAVSNASLANLSPSSKGNSSPSKSSPHFKTQMIPCLSSPCLFQPTKLSCESLSMEFLSKQLDSELGCELSSSSDEEMIPETVIG